MTSTTKLNFYLLVRIFTAYDRADVLIIKRDGPAHSQVAYGHVPQATAEALAKQLADQGIQVVREEDHNECEWFRDTDEPAVTPTQGTLFP